MRMIIYTKPEKDSTRVVIAYYDGYGMSGVSIDMQDSTSGLQMSYSIKSVTIYDNLPE
jgi:hypothetical protein